MSGAAASASESEMPCAASMPNPEQASTADQDANEERTTLNTQGDSLSSMRMRSFRKTRAGHEFIRKSSLLLTGRPTLISKQQVQQELCKSGRKRLVPLYARKALAQEVSSTPQLFIFEVQRTMFGLGFLMLESTSANQGLQQPSPSNRHHLQTQGSQQSETFSTGRRSSSFSANITNESPAKSKLDQCNSSNSSSSNSSSSSSSNGSSHESKYQHDENAEAAAKDASEDFVPRVRIAQIYTDNRGPVVKNTNMRGHKSLLQTGDMVLQIGDWPVHSLEEANSAVHDTEFGSFVAVHILRGGSYARRSSSRASLGTATAAAAMFAAATQHSIDPNLEAEIHNNKDNGDDDSETDASRAARRKRTLLQKAKTEKERIFRESKSRYERKVEALGAANASPFMSEFISGCTELLSSPEVDLLCTVRDAFAGIGIQSRLPRIAQDEVTAPSTAAGAAAAAAPAISGQTASIDLVSLKVVNPIQLYVLFCTLARHLDVAGSLETCSEVLINFGWRPIDRLSLHGLSVLLAKETVVSKIKIQAEDIDTTKDCCLLKPCLHGAPFARAVCTTAPMMLRLRQVCLASSTLDDDSALDLVAAFRACPCLQTLDLRRNRFGVGMARELGTAIADLECGMRLSLETLDLSWNELGGEGVGVLCTLLADAETVSLAELRVAFNGVTDDCAEAVRKLLEKNTLERLQKIDLSCNRLSGAAGLHLAAGLRVNTTVTDMSVSYNALGLDATLQIVASVIDSPVLAALWIENTTSDVSVQGQEGMVFESDSGERAPTFCDGLVQFTWELKEHMNLLRQYRCKEAIEVRVEYPEQLRHLIGGLRWYSPYLGAGSNALDGDGAESENSHLDLANSIFKDRAKEGDSRAFFDTLPVAEASMYTDWQFLEPKLQRFIKDEDKVRGLQEVVNAAYLELHNVHRYYSALGNDHDCIGFNEFMEVIFECQISDASCPDNAAQQAFVAANVELKAESKQEQRAMEANPDNALCLYEFIEALMRLALRKFGDEKKSTRIATSPREAFIWLIVDNIFPRCKRIRSNAFRRDKLYYYDVTVVLSTYRLKIDRLWKEYAGVTGANLLMKKDHWLEMLAATGVSRAAYTQGDRKRGTLYSPLALRLAFWSAQTMDRNRLVRNVRDRARNTSDALSYTEFLEALVWLADALQQDAALVELGLPADAFLSEKLICLLEMLLGSKCTNCFSRASYPALLADLRSKHEPMIYPERADYIFEASVATLNLEGATSEPESDVLQSP